jgi:hypothetical protein
MAAMAPDGPVQRECFDGCPFLAYPKDQPLLDPASAGVCGLIHNHNQDGAMLMMNIRNGQRTQACLMFEWMVRNIMARDGANKRRIIVPT